MNKENNVIGLVVLAGKAYSDFAFTWGVTKSANVPVSEANKLAELTAQKIAVCEEAFAKVEKAIEKQHDDEAYIIRQTLSSYREGFKEFKKLYFKEAEPNA